MANEPADVSGDGGSGGGTTTTKTTTRATTMQNLVKMTQSYADMMNRVNTLP